MARNSANDKENKTRQVLMRGLLEEHPEDAAEILERLSPLDCANVLAEIAPQLGSIVALRMSRGSAARCLEAMPAQEAAALLSEMPSHAAAAVIRCVDLSAREQVLTALPGEAAPRLRALVKSLGGTVGALMDTNLLTVLEGASIREARDLFRRFMGMTSESFYGYVVGSDQTIRGVLSARDILRARGTDRVIVAMHTPVASVHAGDTPTAVLRRPEWEQLRVLPVVDDSGVLLGQIRRDALLRDVEANTTARQKEQADLGAVFLLIAEGYCKGLARLVKGIASTPGPREEKKP
jgi:magnesium transporter